MQAIESLSPEKAQEKTILHELAFNDEDANVSLAALEKLNSFVLWLKMSQIAKQSRVKKAAEKKVNAALLGEGDVTLSRQEIFSFLTETANADLVVQLVPQMLKNLAMLIFVASFGFMYWGGTRPGDLQHNLAILGAVVGFVWYLVNRARIVYIKRFS